MDRKKKNLSCKIYSGVTRAAYPNSQYMSIANPFGKADKVKYVAVRGVWFYDSYVQEQSKNFETNENFASVYYNNTLLNKSGGTYLADIVVTDSNITINPPTVYMNNTALRHYFTNQIDYNYVIIGNE